MKATLRKYGEAPYSVVLLHGGPGVAGYMEPVARELSSECGIVEALQTKDTLNGQTEELLSIIKNETRYPVKLVGHSWGAWLACLFTSTYPEYCDSLTLISCPPFEYQYEEEISKTRMKRLNETELEYIDKQTKILNGEIRGDKNKAFTDIGNIILRLDSYSNPIENPGEFCCDYNIYSKVWPRASHLRKTGELLRKVKKINRPIRFIHGERDPHPLTGITEPLNRLNIQFQMYNIPDCGHYPWLEPHSIKYFYLLMKRLIKD